MLENTQMDNYYNWTEGYTFGKKVAHVVSLLVYLILGIVVIAISQEYGEKDPKVVKTTATVIGSIVIVLSVGAMWPVLSRPVVRGG